MVGEIRDGEEFSAGGLVYTVASAEGRSASVVGYSAGASAIPSTVTYRGWDLSVESIGDSALLNCKTLRSADLSNVAAVGFKAFGNCTLVTDISFGSGLEAIGNYAFFGLSFYDGDTKLTVSPSALRGHAFSGAGARLAMVF
jgi:hypothetical protein